MKKVILIILILFAYSCEDPVPNDYIPQNYLEANLIVGQPIDNIILMRTQPILDTFEYSESIIRDAEIFIRGDGQEFKLAVEPDGERGYFYPDQSYKVKKLTEYSIEIRLADGGTITGNTVTPDTLSWDLTPPDFVQFPIDTINKPPGDSVRWQGNNPESFWGIATTCLDTLNYGQYLQNPTNEKNRRITRGGADNPDAQWRYLERTTWGVLPTSQTPVIWDVFRWYGLHELAVYNTDYNLLTWIIQGIGQSEYDYRLNSVDGDGYGVFGSASVIRDTFLLLKNQP